MTMDAYDKVSEGLLQQFKWEAAMAFPEQMLQDAIYPQARFDPFMRHWVLRVRAQIFGEHLQKVAYPATWWDAVKQRFMPRWLQRWFPVQLQHWSAIALYPKVSLPKEDHILRMMDLGVMPAAHPEQQP